MVATSPCDGGAWMYWRRIMAKVKCLNCGQELESTFRHDFQRCSCENETFVDGGNDYCRYGGVDITKVEVIE